MATETLTDLYVLAGYWGDCAKTLIDKRDHLREMATCDWRRDPEEVRECYRRAASALGPVIHQAVAAQKRLKDRIAELEPPPPPVPPLLTDEEMLALGKEVEEHPTFENMCRQGRPMTNQEMSAVLMWTNKDCLSRFMYRFIDWVAQANAETALAGDTVRLSDDVPSLDMGVQHV